MYNIVGSLDYPKSSAGLSSCPEYPSPQKWPTQGVNRLDMNSLYLEYPEQLGAVGDCISMNPVGKEIRPKPLSKRPITILNPDFGLDIAPSFFKPLGAVCDCPRDRKTAVTSQDSRLIYPLRGNQPLMLDRPAYTGSVALDRIYDDRWTRYGKDYENYENIHAGQFMYYYDKDVTTAFPQPTYTITSDIQTSMLQTPMTGYWPQYKKTPKNRDCRYLSDQQFTRDTVRNREELITLQSGRMLRRQWPVG